jgi:hypothetical protein
MCKRKVIANFATSKLWIDHACKKLNPSLNIQNTWRSLISWGRSLNLRNLNIQNTWKCLISWSRTLNLRGWGIKHCWIWSLEVNSIQFVSKLCSWKKLRVIVFYTWTFSLFPCLAIFKWMWLLCDLFAKLKFCLVFFRLCVCWGSTTICIIVNKEIFYCHMYICLLSYNFPLNGWFIWLLCFIKLQQSKAFVVLQLIDYVVVCCLL